jgi:hypothetical protein
MNQPRDREIERRAYQIWERDGRPEGRAKEHWRQAEQELAGERSGEEPPLPEHYAPGEVGGPGEPQADTGLPEALAQAGEGVPDTRDAGETDDPVTSAAKTPRRRRTPVVPGP